MWPGARDIGETSDMNLSFVQNDNGSTKNVYFPVSLKANSGQTDVNISGWVGLLGKLFNSRKTQWKPFCFLSSPLFLLGRKGAILGGSAAIL